MPDLAVIIPHYDDLPRLERCLAALAPQLAAAGSRAEAVVVDNASPVDLSELAAAYPGLRFVIEHRKGAAEARNRGVAETSAPALAFLDSDCVPAPDWLATALQLSGQDRLIGGRVDTFDETPPPRSGAEAFETVFAFHQKAYVEDKGFSVTANLLASRQVFQVTGPLVAGVSEDVDWCRRAVAAGFPLSYADALAVAHPTRQDWAALSKKWRRTTSEAFLLNGTGPLDRLRWLFRALIVAASGPLHLPKVFRHPRLSPLEKRRAAATLLRLRSARALWMLGQVVRE